jgi:ribose 5-phosphate isomerase B
MHIVIASDHAGYPLKAHLAPLIADLGHAVTDLGAHDETPSDYPDFAAAVGRAVASGRADRGVIVCGSGAGAAIAANKVKGVRCALAHDVYTAHQSVEHDDANVLALGSRVVGINVAEELVRAFLGAGFSGEERHARRRGKVIALEEAFGS